MTNEAIAAQQQPTRKEASTGLPDYMSEVYDWAYVNPKWVRFLDRNAVVSTLLFGNAGRLMRAYLNRIRPGMRVWQVAHVYGDLVRKVAERVGADGHFDVTDVTPIQVSQAKKKLANVAQAQVIEHDASSWGGGPEYDLVCSFFLLHEVPDPLKRAVVDRMLSRVGPNGSLLFVDYHRPAPWQPVGWLLRLVNRYLEPFAYTLWRTDIRDLASTPNAFSWRKRTIFGGVYQIVEVTPLHSASK
ncbi:rhodoquinone biosynthesis methyltransferase RquA [Niveibacterium umoris]|uniref:Ubiquinone/menaquinone biosynthesis C-methylase UbiE n=1 Tax=Niveibacterium umoris TaxID=1193620 RepID=A0A840BIL5_9RHOO|nr:rhodoquinone biosynthesis methyltransferase RquA [Niveibacterium umoris]MBB4011468.1 ubiquinone/menaquinone biosynthesis C-methylase UbiE [Niveibacterium umoris]